MAIATGTALAIAAVVASAASAAGSVVAGQQRAAANRFNAKVAEQRAERERQLGALRARQFREDQKRLLARQRARFASGGVLSSVGTPLLVQEETAAKGKFQENLIRSGAEVQASGLDAQAQASRNKTGQALIGTGLEVGATLLGAANKI